MKQKLNNLPNVTQRVVVQLGLEHNLTLKSVLLTSVLGDR